MRLVLIQKNGNSISIFDLGLFTTSADRIILLPVEMNSTDKIEWKPR